MRVVLERPRRPRPRWARGATVARPAPMRRRRRGP